MELRRLSICIAFFILAVISQCSEARHSLQRRASDYEVSDEMLNDESNDYGTQNDADGGNDADDEDTPEVEGKILTKGESYRLLIGNSVRLECRVSPADAGLVVSWSKEQKRLFLGNLPQDSENKRASLVHNSNDLLIKDVQINDTGRYTCMIMQASNPVSITHVVIVEEPPRITNPETTTDSTIEYEDNIPRISYFAATANGNLREGNDLLLTCDVTGTPKPSIIWSRQRKYGLGGTEPLGEANGVFTGHTFFMKNITKEDAGIYYCYAISDAGNATAMLTVNVIGKPRVHVHHPIVNTDINVEAQLQCAAHEEPAPHIRWYKDGQLIEDSSFQYTISANGSQSTLSVIPRRDEDFGTFTCEAINPHGKHNKSIDLVQSPVIENFDVEGPKLTWTVHSHQPLEEIEVQVKSNDENGEWKTFQVPLPEVKDPTHEYELIYPLSDKSLESGSYLATVRAKNSKSWSYHSEPVVVQLESQAQPIQTASVFRSDGYSLRPTTFAVLSTTLMYVLVRML
uniref:Ig-like domain-containing protein n=1 Tax=Pectinophora gossypiella TaxID=13191 RepID=A0A1E1WJU3_PECGO